VSIYTPEMRLFSKVTLGRSDMPTVNPLEPTTVITLETRCVHLCNSPKKGKVSCTSTRVS